MRYPQSAWAGIAPMRRKATAWSTSAARSRRSAEAAGYAVVREYVGHGIGRAMHEEPQIPNYRPSRSGHEDHGGHVFAVEPMVNVGSPTRP